MATPPTERLRSLVAQSLAGLLIALVVFEAISLAYWLLIPVFPSVLLENKNSVITAILNAETGLFYSSAFLAPVFVIVMLFSWVIWLLRLYPSYRRLSFSVGLNKEKLHAKKLFPLSSSAFESIFKKPNDSKSYVLILILSIVVACSIAAYPYLPSLNQSGRIVGADSQAYVKWVIAMDKESSIMNAFSYAFFNMSSRSLSLDLMFLGWKFSGASIGQFMQFLPVLLASFLVLATFLFARMVGFNSWGASLISLFTAFSFHVTAGMFGGFFSNWVSLVFLYLSWGFLLWSTRKRSWRLLCLATLFQIGVLFAHLETWEMTIAIVTVFLVITFARSLSKRNNGFLEAKLVFAFLVTNALAYSARNFALGTSSTFAEVTQLSQGHLSWTYPWGLGFLNTTLRLEFGVALMNPVLLFLACLGGVAVALDDRLVSRFLTACVATITIPFFLGDSIIQSRILYDLPVQVFSLLGLLFVLKLVERMLVGQVKPRGIRYLVVLLAILVNLNYAFRCSFNLT